jgi:hypothetical protein
MQRLLVPVDVQPRGQKNSRPRDGSEELQSNECMTDHDTSSIIDTFDESIEAVTLRKKIKMSKTGCQIQNAESTRRQLISEFEDISLVSSSDSETTLSIDDDADSLTDIPSTLVWAPIKQWKRTKDSIMWPSQVIDQALCVPNGMLVEVSGFPPLVAGKTGQILVQYFNRDKLGWVDKAQLKLFQEIGRKPKDCAMSARLRKAVNKAVRMLKIEGAKNENRLLSTFSTFEVCSDVEAHETDLKKSKFKILKAGKMERGKTSTKRNGISSSPKLKLKMTKATQKISDATLLQEMDEAFHTDQSKILDSSSLKLTKRRLKAIKSEPVMTEKAKKARKQVSWEQSSVSEKEAQMESLKVSNSRFFPKLSKYAFGNLTISNSIMCFKQCVRNLKILFTNMKQEMATNQRR